MICGGAVEPLAAQVIATLHGQSGAGVAFSEDGQRILTTGVRAARVWDGVTFKPLSRPLDHGAASVRGAFDPAGEHLITTSDDSRARVWSARSGGLLLSLRHESRVRFAAFSPDGKKAVTCGDDEQAKVWDANSGKLLLVLPHAATVRFAVFLPDGNKIITSTGITRVWDAKTGKKLVERGFDSGPNDDTDHYWIRPVAVNNKGTEVASIGHWLGVSWDPSSGDGVFAADTRDVNAWPNLVGFAPNDELVTASRGLQIWQRGQEDKLERLLAAGSPIHDFLFTPDGKYALIAAEDDGSGLWEVASGRQLLELSGKVVSKDPIGLFSPPTREVPCIAMSRDGHRIALGFLSGDTTIVYELRTARR
jgi:WD40 repeat protein